MKFSKAIEGILTPNFFGVSTIQAFKDAKSTDGNQSGHLPVLISRKEHSRVWKAREGFFHQLYLLPCFSQARSNAIPPPIPLSSYVEMGNNANP